MMSVDPRRGSSKSVTPGPHARCKSVCSNNPFRKSIFLDYNKDLGGTARAGKKRSKHNKSLAERYTDDLDLRYRSAND